MRKTLITVALLLGLSYPALAGIIHTPGAPTPPPEPTPTPTSVMQEPTDGVTLNGEIHTPSVSESLTEIVLDVLTLLPSLL